MNRKEFLNLCWRNLLKPLIYFMGIVLCVNFFLNAFIESGPERFIFIASFGLALVFAVVSMLGRLNLKLKELISKKLSTKSKERLWRFERVLEHISIWAYGGMTYYFYERSEWNPVIILSVIELHRVHKIVKERKQTGGNTI